MDTVSLTTDTIKEAIEMYVANKLNLRVRVDSISLVSKGTGEKYPSKTLDSSVDFHIKFEYKHSLGEV